MLHLVSNFYNKAASFWKDYFKEDMPSDVQSDASVEKFRNELEASFVKIQSKEFTEEAKITAYTSANVYMSIKETIEELVKNYHTNSKNTYSVVDCAATDAYYTLPYAHQQHGFIEATAKKQIAITTLMQMCFSEYLSMQGEYLKDNLGEDWDNKPLTYTDNANEEEYITYQACYNKFNIFVEDNLKAGMGLLESEFKINSTAYTGISQDIVVSLNDYMKPEDAQRVFLTIDKYESSHNYSDEISDSEADNSMTLGNTTLESKKIPSELAFYRVMAGDTSKTIYYILDPYQFGNSTEDVALDVGYLSDHIKRYGPSGGSDSLYGDLYPVSVDYLNMIKSFSDGTNKFKIPDKNNLGVYTPLIKVPYFSAACEYNLKDFLGTALPQGNNVYLLTSTYSNNFNTGGNTAVKKGKIHVINTGGKSVDSTYTIQTDEITPDDIGFNSDVYSALLANENTDYKQKFSLTLIDDYKTFNDFYIDSDTGNFPVSVREGTGTAKGGQKITIRFKLNDIEYFDTLTMVRHNDIHSSEVLIDKDDLLNSMELQKDGYYSFNIDMPYSETEFILRSKKSDNPNAKVITRDNGDNAIADFRMVYNGNTYYSGNTTAVKAGDEVELGFKLNNLSQFVSVYAVNNATQEITTLVDKESISNLKPDENSWYKITTKMSNYDTDFYCYAETPEEFVPNELEKDEEGKFIISTYEDLRSMAYYINNNDTDYMNGSYILANDIDVQDRPLEPIGYGDDSIYGAGRNIFNDTFDGQGYTISNFKIISNNSYYIASLFGIVNGEIKNLNLAGNYTASATGSYYGVEMSGVAYRIKENGKVCNVTTNLTYKTELFTNVEVVSGISYSVEGGAVIDKCLVNDIVNFPDYSPIYCGIFYNNSSNKTYRISNCGNTSSVKLASTSTRVNGLIEGGTYADYVLENCYTAVDYNGDNLVPLMKNTNNRNVTASNCYYLNSSVDVNSECTDIGTAVAKEKFTSGEVAYLLNNGVTDGTQVWYQNIDNGKTPDDYPNFISDKNTVYKVDKEDKTYSNSNMPDGYLLGDTDVNGSITIMDATLIQRHCALIIELKDMALINADVNKDETISITDATRIQAHIAQIMPIE